MVIHIVSRQAAPGHQRGFSLIELMVVVMILTVVMGIAVPGLRDLMSGQRVKSASFDLITTAMYARSEAGKRGAEISIKAAASDDLATGWCVIYGTTANCNLAAPEEEPATMRVQQPYPAVSFGWKTTAGRINFNSSGRLAAPVEIEVAERDSGSFKRCVTIGVTGSPSSRSGAC